MKDANKSNVFPTSSAQRQFWMLHEVNPKSPAYNICSAFRLFGVLDIKRLNCGINALLRAHDILRVFFILEEGRLLQQIRPFSDIDIAPEDVCARAAILGGTEEILQKEIERPFHLEKGPLFRVRLLRVRENEHIFMLTMHHIIVDLHSKDIGGHSILLAEISLQLQRIFGPRVTTMSLFQFPTIASLSEYIDFEKKQDDVEDQATERANMQRKNLLNVKTRNRESTQ